MDTTIYARCATIGDHSPHGIGPMRCTGITWHAADLMAEARAWLADLEWADEPDFAAMSDERIRAGVQRHYGGGWAGFAADAA